MAFCSFFTTPNRYHRFGCLIGLSVVLASQLASCQGSGNSTDSEMNRLGATSADSSPRERYRISAVPPTPTPTEGQSIMKAANSPNVPWIPGPHVANGEDVLTWLDLHRLTEKGQPRLFRIPVTVQFKDAYRLELQDAFLGTDTEKPGPPIHLCLDDSTMGISLLDRLRDFQVPKQITLALWIHGFWGRVGGMPESGGKPRTQSGEPCRLVTVRALEKTSPDGISSEARIYYAPN